MNLFYQIYLSFLEQNDCTPPQIYVEVIVYILFTIFRKEHIRPILHILLPLLLERIVVFLFFLIN